MKMTLDQLRVDSYATQVSENELTEIKGGTWWFCKGTMDWLFGDGGGSGPDNSAERYELEHGYDLADAHEQ